MSTSRHEKPDLEATDATTAFQSEQRGKLGGQLTDVLRQINGFNAESRVHEDLWSRTMRMTDQVGQDEETARKADSASANADLDHRAIQAENPDRTGPRPRQWLVAGGTLALDGVACYFAAEALPQAALSPDVEAEHRPAVYRQGPRHRGPVFGPASRGAGAVR